MTCETTPQLSSATEARQWRRDGTWPSDNELHLLIDVGRSPVFVHVSGTLDAGTGTNLDPVIREVISEGHLRFDLDIDRLDIVDPVGFDALAVVRRSIVSAGGTLSLVHDAQPPVEGPPFPSSLSGYGATLTPRRAARTASGAITGPGA